MRFGAPEHARWLPSAAAFAAIVGHVWPLWHGFRGGKGAATALGGIAMLWPAIVPWLFALWALFIVFTGYVGLSTIVTALGFAAAAAIANHNAADHDLARIAFAFAIAALIVFSHRANLARLRAGTESRFEKAMLLRRLGKRDDG
jgi:glycerol-3-phosphate acyltransferase PlsY